MLLESSIALLENIYSTGITHDKCHLQSSFTIVIYNRHLLLSFTIVSYNRHLQSSFTIVIYNRHLQSSFTIVIFLYYRPQK